MQVYQVRGMPVSVSTFEHYLNRGKDLSKMALNVYALTIQIVPALASMPPSSKSHTPDDARDGRGRPKMTIYRLSEEHPLVNHYVQQERAKFKCPLHVGPTRARFPQAISKGETPSSAWRHQYDRACRYYSSTFFHWGENGTPSHTTSEAFRAAIANLRKEATLDYKKEKKSKN